MIFITLFIPILCTFPFAMTLLKLSISAEIQVTHFWFIISFFLQILLLFLWITWLFKRFSYFYRRDKKNVSLGNQNNFPMHMLTNFNIVFHCVLLKIKDAKYFCPKPYLRDDSRNFFWIIIVNNITNIF